MKKIVLIVVVIMFALMGCNKENKMEIELKEVVSNLKESLIQEDIDKLISHVEEGTSLYEALQDPGFDEMNFLSFETIEETLKGREADVKLKTNFEESTQQQNKSIRLIGILTLRFHHTHNGWKLYSIETELDPSSTRPPGK